jgi:hypothetical protein
MNPLIDDGEFARLSAHDALRLACAELRQNVRDAVNRLRLASEAAAATA